jgi:hypothetical protein
MNRIMPIAMIVGFLALTMLSVPLVRAELPDAGLGTSLQLESTGKSHIAYWDTLGRGVRYARWDGSQWIIQVVDGAGQ